MKKILIVVILSLITLLILKEDYYTIPNEAIRFRIIANSNNAQDIQIKQIAAHELNTLISTFDTSSIDSTRKSITQNLNKIEHTITKVFKKNNYDETFIIRYGINEFPEKKYKGVRYNEGLYESLIIEIGAAKGNNYWCVLYPPLCLIDETTKKIEYKSKVIEVIKKYF